MSNVNVPPFDLLSGFTSPYEGFGEYFEPSTERFLRYDAESREARKRLEDGFQVHLSGLELISTELDTLAAEMWEQGWNPRKNNINLFTTDFGLVLSRAILETLGGTVVLRSDEDISHLSIWWQQEQLEAFPFHKILKRLCHREGESIRFFIDGLKFLLSNQKPQ